MLSSSRDLNKRGRRRDELLNETLFTSLAQVRVVIEDWRRDYNTLGDCARFQ